MSRKELPRAGLVQAALAGRISNREGPPRCSSRRASSTRILPRLIVSLMLVVGAIGESGPAWAWGDLGHKIVCQIAFQELNDKAQARWDSVGTPAQYDVRAVAVG